MPLKILGIGSPLVDYTVPVGGLFIEQNISGDKGGTVHIDRCERKRIFSLLDTSPLRTPGGSAANTIYALARLGGNTAFCGKLGDDEDGSYFKSEMHAAGVAIDEVITVPGNGTGYCISLVTPDAERTMRSDLGVSTKLTAAEFQRCCPEKFDWIHFEGYTMELPEFPEFLRIAKSAGCRISFDLASFELAAKYRQLLYKTLPDCIDLLFANVEESSALSGTGTISELLAQAGKLAPLAVIKDGAKGSYIMSDGNSVCHIPAVKISSPAVDTTGAGDFYSAGFLYALSMGASPEICGKCASIPAGEIVQHAGSRPPENVWQGLRAEIAKLIN